MIGRIGSVLIAPPLDPQPVPIVPQTGIAPIEKTTETSSTNNGSSQNQKQQKDSNSTYA